MQGTGHRYMKKEEKENGSFMSEVDVGETSISKEVSLRRYVYRKAPGSSQDVVKEKGDPLKKGEG